jgi:hypothetical protein
MERVVTVVSKEGCHLCETVVSGLRSLSSRYGFEVRVLDISEDRELHDAYYLRIPVVKVEGKEVFEAKDMDHPRDCEAELERRLAPWARTFV